jgi:hypothetical protein
VSAADDAADEKRYMREGVLHMAQALEDMVIKYGARMFSRKDITMEQVIQDMDNNGLIGAMGMENARALAEATMR